MELCAELWNFDAAGVGLEYTTPGSPLSSPCCGSTKCRMKRPRRTKVHPRGRKGSVVCTTRSKNRFTDPTTSPKRCCAVIFPRKYEPYVQESSLPLEVLKCKSNDLTWQPGRTEVALQLVSCRVVKSRSSPYIRRGVLPLNELCYRRRILPTGFFPFLALRRHGKRTAPRILKPRLSRKSV